MGDRALLPGQTVIAIFKASVFTLLPVYGRRGYNRIDWAGEFGCADPQRANHMQGEIVNPLGFTTNHAEILWGNP